jgi:hypothetical protein
MSGDSGFDEVPGSERDGGVSWTRAVAAIAVDGGLRFLVRRWRSEPKRKKPRRFGA